MARVTEEDLKNSGTSNSKNKPEDPSGQYPSTPYFYSQNIAKQARGVSRNDLEFFSHWPGIELNTGDKVPSEYPLNQVLNTDKGHAWEIDDTDGNERILIKHAEGSGVELKPDGSIVISSKTNKVEVCGGDNNVIVEGDAQLVYKGNLSIKVVGEFNVDCLDYNLTVNGNKVESVIGNEKKTIGNGVETSVTGPIATYSTGLVTDVFLGGHQHNVKGNLDYNVNGNIGIFGSDALNITSQDYANIASDNVTMSAQNMTVQGGSGTIGGTSVDFVGNGAIFDKGVTSTVFTGNLNGKANDAAQADYATTAGAAPLGSAGEAGNTVDTDTPTITTPTATNVLTYLTKAAGGIRKVLIDKGDYLKNFIDKSSRYDGISNGYMSSAKARSKLRDTSNSGNNTFVGTLLRENWICAEYNNPTPRRIGRTVKQESTPILSNKPKDIYTPQIAATYVPKFEVGNIVPEAQYNPLNQDDITIQTKLNKGITIAKFLGSEDATNLKHIRDLEVKRKIAQHLYLQALVLKRIQEDNETFKGINLVVSEGIYRPGPSETMTKGGINDLKSKGRAIVYKAVDQNGIESALALFDIAEFLKDSVFYEEMKLSYDTLECDGAGLPVLKARLIITMPELDDNWSATFNRKVSTEYNRQLLSQGELIECLLESFEDLEEKAIQNSAVPPSDGIVTHSRGPDRKNWPNQRIVDSIAEAVRELGPRYSAQITPNGGRASRATGTQNHPVGEAADHYLLLDGNRIDPSDNRSLYVRYIKLLVKNANARGVRPGIGGYPSFIHYDESGWRQGKAGSAGTWNNGFDVSFAKSL
jgi:hypothetical protein